MSRWIYAGSSLHRQALDRLQMEAMGAGPDRPHDPATIHGVKVPAAPPGAAPHLPPPRPRPRGKTTRPIAPCERQRPPTHPPAPRPLLREYVMTAVVGSRGGTAPSLCAAATGCRYSSSSRCRSRSHTERRRRCASRPLCSASGRSLLARPPFPSLALPLAPRSAPDLTLHCAAEQPQHRPYTYHFTERQHLAKRTASGYSKTSRVSFTRRSQCMSQSRTRKWSG
jgi:hypothetical protein